MQIATLCYIQENSKTLMIEVTKEGMHKGKNNAPGGKIDLGETLEECVIRETWEETGLRVRDPKKVGIIHFPKNNMNGKDWDVHIYIGTDFEGVVKENSPEGKLFWVNNDEILNLNIHGSDRIFIPWVLEGKYFEATFQGDDLANVDFYETNENVLKKGSSEQTGFR